MSDTSFGPGYYADRAGELGWGADHTPDPFKLGVLREHVRGDVVLDVACGPGVYSAALAAPGRRVIGADWSRALLQQGRRHHPAGWLPAAASGFALPLRDASVDTTCLLSVLEHVDDAAMLREAVRVTRSRIVIQVPLSEPKTMADAGVLFSHWSDRSHLRTYSEAGLSALVASAGWRVTRFIPAYPRDLQELFVRSMGAPEIVRNAVRALLKPFRGFGAAPPAEAFIVAERG